MKSRIETIQIATIIWLTLFQGYSFAAPIKRPNIILIMSDDLTRTSLGCYGNAVCRTPNIDRLASQGIRFTNAYCQATYCGPSRASMLSGYYPDATKIFGYTSPRPVIQDRETWPEFFKNRGYSTHRFGKIYHMGVPGEIESGVDGADDPKSWTTRTNIAGPEWKAAGVGETLEGNPEGKKPIQGGNTFVYVKSSASDLEHADGKTAQKAIEWIQKKPDHPFFLAVGFVRPHVPFVAPSAYFESLPRWGQLELPKKIPQDWNDIPKAGINYKTSQNMRMSIDQQKKAIWAYYASVQYIDSLVGKMMNAVESAGIAENTIIIFTSDHGFHLGEHDFWAKVSLHEESATVPLIIRIPKHTSRVATQFVGLIDLFPTTCDLCGFEIPSRIQGRSLKTVLSNPDGSVRESIFSVSPMQSGYLLRNNRWAYLQYGEQGEKGVELYDMQSDPHQITNLAMKPEWRSTINERKTVLQKTLAEIRNSDLNQ
ncbi:sulfatase [Tuwongella immobilis]|uniref:Sulfatase N-terminal domain-containing protein n=1 Tax=Tuwongella immobilis TaxID=692036 RepID=A0A6C2YP06_9BACT|nr:sulfatase [Tuwongella immobilis]VIP02863.1 iduronate-2-sulfatase : Iduronate-2-sulfatase OS=Rhodopirellula europaea 6C GN=RE6C_03737 PE=4 SV=1: Sulfatase [Tuwongella immobilis]VTS02677.1 iduronate-2-sulfatase : Iduronate-2-sulfatase OS=Rhodopirellula europaea 6C GN=RE6C_03737 PE=4 SV=1: Sulfatase [Tuwongella immobilis]